MASVVSAAILEGSLIIGLDDGSVINCGYVQGPQGLKGDPGPEGATGEPGLDGNTIHTVGGTPRNDMGVDGDYAIDNINWRIYGPKSGGVWGKAKEMLPGKEVLENGRTYSGATGGGGGGAGDPNDPGNQIIYTNMVIATGQGRFITENAGTPRALVHYNGTDIGILTPEQNMSVQANINKFFVDKLEELEFQIPVTTADQPPNYEPLYNGKLYFDTEEDELTLYVFIRDDSNPDDQGRWVAAAPPVSLEGIESVLSQLDEYTQHLQAQVDAVQKSHVPFEVFQPYAQKIELLETELDKLEGNFIDVDLTYKFAYAPQRAPEPGCAYLRVGDDASSQKPTYAQAQWLNVSNVDRAGNPIDWATVAAGNEIVIESLDGEGYGIYKAYDPVIEAEDWIKIQLVLDPDVEDNNEGQPTELELVRIKVSDTAGLSNYVRKQGDTMSGTLNISNVPDSKTGDGPLKLYGLKKSPTNDDIITSPIFQGGHVPTGSFLQYTGRTSNSNDLVNKGYVDSKARTSEIELSQLAEDETDPDLLERISVYENPTQKDLNNEIGWTFFNQRRKGTRTSTNVNIVQNTKVDGQWTFVEPLNPNSLPETGEFFMFGENGAFTSEWAETKVIRINGTDRFASDLSTIRRGTQLLLQDVALNSFAHYITDDVQFIGQVEGGGQFFVELLVSAIFERASGSVPLDTVCEIKAFSPHPCVNTKDGSPPLVDDDGFLWYDELNKKLYVSDWDDEQSSNGTATWIEVGAGSGEVTGDYLPLTGGKLTGKLETTDKIWIRPGNTGANGANNMLVVNQKGADGGSIARFQKDAVDILKIEHSRTINACGNNIIDVADPTAEKHAANKEYVDNAVAGVDFSGDFVAASGTTKVSSGWKIESTSKSHFHVENGQTKIYWLQDPQSAQHPVTLNYADGKYATKSNLDAVVSTAKKGAYLIFNCNKDASSIYSTEAIRWVEESSKVKLIVSCDAMDDYAQISRDRYRGPDFAKTAWETPISIMRLSGDNFEDENPILQAKTEHVRVLTYNSKKYFNIWFDPNNALTWRPEAFTGTQEGNNPGSVRSRISISGIWSPR